MTHYKEYTIIPIVFWSLGSCRILSINSRGPYLKPWIRVSGVLCFWDITVDGQNPA